jgi:L-fuconolactonase
VSAPPRVVDAHLHFWDPHVLRYAWLNENPRLCRAFGPTDYDELQAGAVSAAVFVEANCHPDETLDEVRFVEGIADACSSIAGIVAYLDIGNPRVTSETLERLAERARVVGVRHNIQGHASGYCTTTTFVDAIRELGRRGLPFDLCITASQLEDARTLVARCPDTLFVLDHCGKPAIRNDDFATWAADLELLAQHDNVVCKLSGLLTEARDDQRNDRGILPYADHALQCFGDSRILYGSDWPVVSVAGGAAAWRAMVDRFTSGWLPSAQQALFADNAIRLYRLPLHVAS